MAESKETKAPKTTKKVESVNAEAEAPVSKNVPKSTKAAAPVDKSKAKSKRILAVIFWVLAIACEVLALMVFLGKLDLGFTTQMTQLIAFLVLDFILVVVGAQFWKQANHMDPISEEKAFKFWLWNNMGVVVCCFAFIPFLIYVLFVDKEADPKLKKVASIVAAVALVLGVGLSYDYNPVSEEGLAQAQETLADETVYWTQFGKVYHTDLYCQHLNRTAEPFEGDVATAISEGKTRLCKTCAKNAGIEIQDNGAIVSAAEPLAEAAEEVDEAA
jgi:Amino acid permeases